MNAPTAEERQEARRPLASLLSKSEKARQKLAAGTWQHTRLGETVDALRIALALVDDAPSRTESLPRADLEEARRALASVAARAGTAQFAPGTSQHTLQQNRLRALRVADALVSVALSGRDAGPGAASDSAGR